jgi:hypothetical protein
VPRLWTDDTAAAPDWLRGLGAVLDRAKAAEARHREAAAAAGAASGAAGGAIVLLSHHVGLLGGVS